MPSIPNDYFAGGAHLTESGPGGLASLLNEGDTKASVRAASTANVANLAAVSATMDGVTLVKGNRVLLKDQATQSQKGVYTVGDVSGGLAPLTRAQDADVSAEVTSGLQVFVEEGTANGGKYFTCTTANPIVLGTTSLAFTLQGSPTDLASMANGKGASLVGVEDAAATIAGSTAEAALAELSKRVLGTFATEAAIKAIPAAARTNGAIAVDATNDVVWLFDTGSAAGASAWVLVPDAGTGRWLRASPSLADLASTVAAFGASLIGINDAGTIITATTVEAALQEIKTLVDAGMTVLKKTVTVAHTDFDGLGALDTSEAINVGTVLPANARIVGTDLRAYTPFTGGGNSAVTADVGTAGDADALIAAADVFAVAVDGGPATIPQGIRPHKTMGAAQLLVTFTADVGLAELTAGSIIVDVLYTILA